MMEYWKILGILEIPSRDQYDFTNTHVAYRQSALFQPENTSHFRVVPRRTNEYVSLFWE